MDITPQIIPGQKVIQSYRAGGFRVNGDVFESPILITPDHVAVWNLTDPANPFELTDDIRALSGKIDVLLIGAGDRFSVLTPLQRSVYAGLGFSVEAMDTPAACRTYNVLMSEGRLIAAALKPCS